jgi:hypothetical protein
MWDPIENEFAIKMSLLKLHDPKEENPVIDPETEREFSYYYSDDTFNTACKAIAKEKEIALQNCLKEWVQEQQNPRKRKAKELNS